jgi:hypothetical protein
MASNTAVVLLGQKEVVFAAITHHMAMIGSRSIRRCRQRDMVLPPGSLEQLMSQFLLYSALFIAMAIGAADIWMRMRGEIDRVRIWRSRRAGGQ